MVIFLCVVLWLLAGFCLTKLLFIVTEMDYMSLCVVIVLSLFGPVILMPVIIEYSDKRGCPYPAFFKRKYK